MQKAVQAPRWGSCPGTAALARSLGETDCSEEARERHCQRSIPLRWALRTRVGPEPGKYQLPQEPSCLEQPRNVTAASISYAPTPFPVTTAETAPFHRGRDWAQELRSLSKQSATSAPKGSCLPRRRCLRRGLFQERERFSVKAVAIALLDGALHKHQLRRNWGKRTHPTPASEMRNGCY